MDQYELIRTAHRVYEKSIRQIRRDTGHHRKTIRKALSGEEPKYRRKKRVKCTVMDSVAGVVKQWLREDRSRPKKQRHTARRIYRRLVQEQGFEGAESTVRRWVREWPRAGEARRQWFRWILKWRGKRKWTGERHGSRWGENDAGSNCL